MTLTNSATLPVHVPGNPGPTTDRWLLIVDDTRVRWRQGRDWRCDDHGYQTRPECRHTFSAAIHLAERLLGLTRVPELDPHEED